MEISKSFSISTDYKHHKAPPSWQTRLFAEVVLIDTTHNALSPTVYLLKDSIIPSQEQILYWKSGALKLPDEAFVLMGQAVSIDRKNKNILIDNNNTIGYHYLVIARGKTPNSFTFDDENFLMAIHALVDAIRIKQKIPSSFAKYITMQRKKLSSLSAVQRSNKPASLTSNAIESIAQPYICRTPKHNFFGLDLHAINKRLYEVHL